LGNLLLPSLEVANFRAFRHLRIERLARVNLIVGKNNVGKSSLLEALWLYAHRGSWSSLWDLIERRDEGHRPGRQVVIPEGIEAQAHAYAQLFYGRPDLALVSEGLAIGSAQDGGDRLTISVGWKKNQPSIPGLPPNHLSQMIGLVVHRSGLSDITHDFALTTIGFRDVVPPIPCQFAHANGLGQATLGQLWNEITLTEREEDVIRALQIIAPDVLRVNVRVDSRSGQAEQERTVIVRLRSSDEQVRLRSLGDGMNRMFGIALTLVNAKGGLLLVDEIENGLHYSALPDMWRLIFDVAARLNVQVFATTHSWDCIEAFQIAAAATVEEGEVIRLGWKGHDVVATLFDEQELALIARDQIEVR